MKLYTVCDKKDNELSSSKAECGLCLVDYSEKDYVRLMSRVRDLYVTEHFSWYETDMSDSDSGSEYNEYGINYTNLVVLDGQPYGVLVKTRGLFPEYYVMRLRDKKLSLALGGGYNDLDYDWEIKTRKPDDPSADYVYYYDYTVYYDGKFSQYQRRVVGFSPRDVIYEGEKAVGLRRRGEDGAEFRFDEPDGFYRTDSEKRYDGATVNCTRALLPLTPKLAEAGIRSVFYPDFKDGRYEILGERVKDFI